MLKRGKIRYPVIWACILLVLISLSVPWFFIPFSAEPFLFGIPYWVIHSLAVIVLYILTAAAAILLLWDKIADEAD